MFRLRASFVYVSLLLTGLLACSSGTGPGAPTVPPTHTALGAVDTSLNVPGRPHGVGVGGGSAFCISQIDGNSIACGSVTATSEQLGPAIPVGQTPAHVVVDRTGRTAYTANQTSGTVSVVNIAIGVLNSIPLSDGGFNFLLSPDGRLLYVTTAAGVLHVISTASRAVLDTFSVGSQANGLAFDSTNDILYVSALGAATVTAIDANTDAVIRTYPVSAQPQRIAVSADGATVYIASESVGLELLECGDGQSDVGGRCCSGRRGPRAQPGRRAAVRHESAGGHRGHRGHRHAGRGDAFRLCLSRNVAFAAHGATAIVTGEGNQVYFIR